MFEVNGTEPKSILAYSTHRHTPCSPLNSNTENWHSAQHAISVLPIITFDCMLCWVTAGPLHDKDGNLRVQILIQMLKWPEKWITEMRFVLSHDFQAESLVSCCVMETVAWWECVRWASVDNAVVTVILISKRFTRKVAAFCQTCPSLHPSRGAQTAMTDRKCYQSNVRAKWHQSSSPCIKQINATSD